MPGAKIFLVEDEALIALELRDRLEGLGHEVCGHAARGDEALARIPWAAPDLVLMDVGLGEGMDGIETASRLRERSPAPVVFLTAYADPATLERAKAVEPFGYLVKPFDERELHATIEMALYKHRMERERERLRQELATALARVKVLSGLLPICAGCKKIRDDKGYWQQIEAYLADHSDARFSHGLCPDCIPRYFPSRG